MNEALTWLQSNPNKWIATGVVLLAIGCAALLWEIWKDNRRK